VSIINELCSDLQAQDSCMNMHESLMRCHTLCYCVIARCTHVINL